MSGELPLVLATRNAGKLRELRALLDDRLGLRVQSLQEWGGAPEVVEDGDTFEDNAIEKARAIAAHTRTLVLADDSGLEVDALGGRPGVRSARYAGAHGDDEANNERLLRELAATPDPLRTARYRVVLALSDPEGPLAERVHTEVGACEGRIVRVARGGAGFGYDPLFEPRGYAQTMAELPAGEKNRISHRALAAEKMRAFLAGYLPRRRRSP